MWLRQVRQPKPAASGAFWFGASVWRRCGVQEKQDDSQGQSRPSLSTDVFFSWGDGYKFVLGCSYYFKARDWSI